MKTFPSTDLHQPSDNFNFKTIWIFRPLSSIHIDDVVHRYAGYRRSCTCRQVWVVSTGCQANLFQGSNTFCRYDNIRNTNKELLTRWQISRLTWGLPGPLDLHFQKSLNPFRCQRTKVSGVTMTRDLRQGLQIRESNTQKSRSAIRIFGPLFARFITTNCWRSARFSAARLEVILNFDQTNKTRFPSVFIMITAWQAHANLSMISESTNNCEGHQRKRRKGFGRIFFFVLDT